MGREDPIVRISFRIRSLLYIRLRRMASEHTKTEGFQRLIRSNVMLF
jgi:hypothetical protein